MDKPELSQKSKYFLPRHRYYELKHFCLQYPGWKHHLQILSDWPHHVASQGRDDTNRERRPTEQIIMKRMFLTERIELIEKIANATDPVIGNYILKGVTEGRSYEQLNAVNRIPCCKNTYYDLYHKFFYLLSEARQ